MNLADSKIVLIGGAGLIGSHLTDLLVAEGAQEIVIFDNLIRGTRANLAPAMRSGCVRLVEGDIRDPAPLRSALQGAKAVFHLAALWLLQCAEDPSAGFEVNVRGTFHVLETCRQLGVEKLIFSSSASVYGDALVSPMGEDHPLNNRNFYGATKVAGEQFLRAFHEMYDLDYAALRYFNVYGPRQDYNGAYVSVIMKVLDRLDAGLPPLIFGDGSQAYDFIYVGDVARANLAALQSDVRDETLNICTGIKTSINELVHLLLELTGSNLEPEYRPAEQQFVIDRLGDPGKARDLMGFECSIPLREGLGKLIAWRAEQIQRSET